MGKLAENSIISRTNALVVTLAVALFLGSSLLTLYGWIMWQVLKPFDVFVELVFALVLVQRAAAKYYYELDKKVIRITKSIFGHPNQYEISYRDILGVYRHPAKSTAARSFGRSYRLHSALDGRLVWTIAYNQPDNKGRMETRRVYFKPSEKMLAALMELLPDKVKTSEGEIAGRHPAKPK